MSGGSLPRREPNWSKWRLIPEVKVWQAVALSLNIDPDKVQRNPNAWMGSGIAFREGQDFKDRLDIACANIGSRHALVPVAYPGGHKGGYPVKLQVFATWCVSIDWSIPDGLRALARPSTDCPTLGNQDAIRSDVALYAGGVTWVDAEYDERLRDALLSVTEAVPSLETLTPHRAPKPAASSEGTHRPSNAGTAGSAPATAADEYFSEQNARQAAQVAEFANEAGLAQLVASVDAKDLYLNLAPDWPHWANMAYVTVGDAACLSLGISPEARLPQINLSNVRKRAQEFNVTAARVHLGVAALEKAQRLIQQRVDQASSAIEAGRLSIRGPRNLPQVLGLESPPAFVSLSRYRRWAESLPQPYIFPEGFPPAELLRAPAVILPEQPETPVMDDEKPLREPERGNWLAIIHALAEMAKLPERGATSSVERQLQQLGYETPKERTIRAVLNEARKSKD